MLESSQRIAEQPLEFAELLDCGRVQDLDVNRPVAVDDAVAEPHRVPPGNVGKRALVSLDTSLAASPAREVP